MEKRFGDLKAGEKFTYYGILYLMCEAVDISTNFEDDEFHECCLPINIANGKYGVKSLMSKGDDTLVKVIKIKETV